MTRPLLEIDHLNILLPVGGAPRPVIHDVSLSVAPGEALGLVGESGSGKSMTLRAVTRLLPPGAQIGGVVRFDGRDVGTMDKAALRAFRAHEVAVVFQDPRAHVNPMRSIGDFLTEGLTTTRGVKRAEAERRAIALLADVGVADASRRLKQRPHELSGGLLQRVMIAAALAIEPRLILADEPTTALDVTTQEEVMAILDEQRRERGLAMVFVTHDLELAAAVCDRTAVMYAGSIVDEQPSARLHDHAAHPYTVALLAARPGLTAHGERLQTVEGRPLSAFEAPPGCAFAPRCPRAQDVCRAERPPLRAVADGRAACHFAEEVAHA
jgi:oligopeptide/dipeptide ABC transporter ATP-binding protein